MVQELRGLEVERETLLFQVDVLQDTLEGVEELLAEAQREAGKASLVCRVLTNFIKKKKTLRFQTAEFSVFILWFLMAQKQAPVDAVFCLFVGAGTRARCQEETGEPGELSDAGGGEIKGGKMRN